MRKGIILVLKASVTVSVLAEVRKRVCLSHNDVPVKYSPRSERVFYNETIKLCV